MAEPHGVQDLTRGIGLFTESSFPTNIFYVKNAPLSYLIQMAYKVDDQDHISSMPSWAESQIYTISAKVEGDQQLTLEDMRPLLQDLLKERFHFAAHAETKVVSGFALVVAKGGPRLQISKEGVPGGQILPNGINVRHMKLSQFAGVLAHRAGEPVVDRTGLDGAFDIKLSYAPANDPASELPDFSTALQEQLGLKLQPEKVPVSFLVIDHLDRTPTEN